MNKKYHFIALFFGIIALGFVVMGLCQTNKNTNTYQGKPYSDSGTFQLGIMYTSNQNGKIAVSVNDQDATGPLLIPSTFVAEDSVAWRQWHHWNYIDSISQVDLKEGLQTLTIHTVEIGQMNYEYIDFKWIK